MLYEYSSVWLCIVLYDLNPIEEFSSGGGE